MNKEELDLINKLNDPEVQRSIENLTASFDDKAEDTLFEDSRTLEEVIREVAEEEGMTYEQTLALFKKGMRDARGILSRKKPTAQQKAKAKKKKKMAKVSKKRNR